MSTRPNNKTPRSKTFAACRKKATRSEMLERRRALLNIVLEIQPCTVRQAYYQATVRNLVEKTEAGYDKVQRAIVELRRSGELPYGAIADNTRWMRKPVTYSRLSDALEATATFYRRDQWADSSAYVEIWLEKDALSGVLMPVTSRYDVPLMVARGYASLTFLASAAEAIREQGKPAYIYHLGDLDPSGVNAAEKIESTLRELAPDAEIHFERLGVTDEQVRQWQLPSRPTKTTDSRHKTFGRAQSVELDAIAPDQLRELAESAILRHVDPDQLRTLRVAENSERSILRMFAKSYEIRGVRALLGGDDADDE